MRILRAEITGFGHYRQRTFDFTKSNQLVFGENEAGKSTLYQFIQAILFGFPMKRGRRKDYTPQDGTSFGGRLILELPTYGEVTVERYKQVDRGRAKVFFQGKQGDEKTWLKLVAPLTLQAFQQVYTFQQEQLSQLEQLREKELHDALVSLGISGSRQLLAKRQEYLQQSQKLFKPRGQKLPLNQQVKKWQELAARITAKEQEESHFHELLQRQEQADRQVARLQKELQLQEERLLHLKEQLNYWPQYEEWQQLKGLKATEAQTDPQRLAIFYQRYTQLHQQLLEQQESLQKLEAKQDLSEKYRFYLKHENEIKHLLDQQVAAVRVTDDFQRALQDQKELIQQLEELEERYGWAPENPPIGNAGDLYHYLNEKQRIEAVVAEKTKQDQWLREEMPTKTAQRPAKLPLLLAIGLLLSGGSLAFTGNKWGWLLLIVGLVTGAVLLLKQRQPATAHSLMQDPRLQQQLTENRQSLQQEQEKLQRIEKKLQRLMPDFAADQLTMAKVQDYQAAVQVYHEANEELQQVDTKLEGLDREYGRFEKAFDFLAPWLPLLQNDLVGKLALLRAFSNEMEQIRLQEKLPAASVLREQIKDKQQQVKSLLQENQGLLRSAGINQPSEIPLWLDKLQKLEKNQRREQELTQILEKIYPQPVELKKLQTELARTEARIRELHQQRQQETSQQQRQLLQIQQLQADGTLDELYQQRSDLEDQIRELALEWSSFQVSSAVLNDLATELSAQQLPQLLQSAGHYFQLLTEGSYQSIDFVAGELVVRTNEQTWQIYDLSTGTRDQLVMAIRFGYLALQKGRPLCPVIIDDGWLHYDSQRKAQLAQLLAEFGKNYQVICLSSDQEMVSYYQKLQQPVVTIG